MNNRPTYTHGSSTVDGSTDQFPHSRALDEMDQLPEPNFDWRPIPPGLSEEEAISLATPQVVLYANWNDEGHEALRAFEQEQIGLSLIVDSEAFLPRAVWANNIFLGLEQIETLLKSLRAMNAQIIADMKRADVTHPRPRDPLLAQWMATITDRQLAAARTTLDDLQASHRRTGRFRR